MRYVVAAFICAALLALALTWAALGTETALTDEDLTLLTGTDWYSVLVRGQRSGYACVQVQPAEVAGEQGLRVTEDVKILITMGAQELEAAKSQVTLFDNHLRPVSIELFKNELGRTSRLQATLADDELTISRHSAADNEDNTRTLTVADDFASDLLIAWRAARGDLKVGDSFSYQSYDPELDALDRYQVSVPRTEQVGETPALVVTAASEKLGIEVINWLDASGHLLRQQVPGLMDLTLERVTEAEALADLSPFEVSSEVRVSGRLPARHLVDSVEMRVRRRVGPAAELLPTTPRQQVVADGDDALVTITRERPPLESATLPVTDPELAGFLAATTHAQSDAPAIVAKAREIVGEETDAWAAAQKIVGWVYHNMKKVQSEPRPITAVECLDTMTGDCTEHAVLTTALARAAGLPARMAVGLIYVGGAFGYHAWSEIYVGRWVEMDPSWGQMTVDAEHLLLQTSALDDVSYARASLATGRTLGAIEIDLLAYVGTDGRRVELHEQQPPPEE